MSTNCEPKKTKWLYVGESFIIEKDQIKQCRLVQDFDDRYNIICTTKDEKSRYILPIAYSYDRTVKYFNDIHRQLEN